MIRSLLLTTLTLASILSYVCAFMPLQFDTRYKKNQVDTAALRQRMRVGRGTARLTARDTVPSPLLCPGDNVLLDTNTMSCVCAPGSRKTWESPLVCTQCPSDSEATEYDCSCTDPNKYFDSQSQQCVCSSPSDRLDEATGECSFYCRSEQDCNLVQPVEDGQRQCKSGKCTGRCTYEYLSYMPGDPSDPMDSGTCRVQSGTICANAGRRNPHHLCPGNTECVREGDGSINNDGYCQFTCTSDTRTQCNFVLPVADGFSRNCDASTGRCSGQCRSGFDYVPGTGGPLDSGTCRIQAGKQCASSGSEPDHLCPVGTSCIRIGDGTINNRGYCEAFCDGSEAARSRCDFVQPYNDGGRRECRSDGRCGGQCDTNQPNAGLIYVAGTNGPLDSGTCYVGQDAVCADAKQDPKHLCLPPFNCQRQNRNKIGYCKPV